MIDTARDWIAYIYSKQGKMSPEEMLMFKTYCEAMGFHSINVSIDHLKQVTQDATKELEDSLAQWRAEHEKWLDQFEQIFKGAEDNGPRSNVK